MPADQSAQPAQPPQSIKPVAAKEIPALLQTQAARKVTLGNLLYKYVHDRTIQTMDPINLACVAAAGGGMAGIANGCTLFAEQTHPVLAVTSIVLGGAANVGAIFSRWKHSHDRFSITTTEFETSLQAARLNAKALFPNGVTTAAADDMLEQLHDYKPRPRASLKSVIAKTGHMAQSYMLGQ